MSYAPITKNGVDAADPLSFETRRISISTQVQHRGRTLTITSEGYTADELCDLLDKRFGPAAAAPNGRDTAAAPPICPVHNKPMKLMTRADRQGNTHWCTQKSGDDYCKERA